MSTLFQKFTGLEVADTADVLGESLRVEHIRHHAASKTLYLYGEHEDSDQQPRYTAHLDAREDSVEILPTDRTDTHRRDL